MFRRPFWLIVVAGWILPIPSIHAAQSSQPDWAAVRPVLARYCHDCHGGKKTKGGIDLKKLEGNPDVAANFELWEKVKHLLEEGEMPPEDDPQPGSEERKKLLTWLDSSLDTVAKANAGDPGLVTVRRLTNFEYDNTIRDLTGIDYGLSERFQPDGGGGEGFSNVGDILFVNPQQLDSYLSAARQVTEHASILPGRGILFRDVRVGLRSPDQLRTEADQALYIWYQKMAEPHLPKDGEDRRGDEYMLAAWKYLHREKTGAKSLNDLAREAGLSAAFLENWWNLLNTKNTRSRFLDMIIDPWRALPGPSVDKPKEVPAQVVKGIEHIEAEHLSWNKRSGEGWVRTQRRQQDTDGLRTRSIMVTIPENEPFHLVAGDFGDGNVGDLILFERIEIEHTGKRLNYVDWLKRRIESNKKEIADLKAREDRNEGEEKRLKGIEAFGGECEAMLKRFGKHPQEGRSIGATQLAIRPPELIRLPWDGGRVRVRVSAKMDLKYPDADKGSHQWTIAGGNPPAPDKIIPGALIIYKRQTGIAREIMGEFSRMKAAFPDEYPRLLEQVARNYLYGGKGNGVYYFNDQQLRAMLDDEQRHLHELMLRDWALLRNTKPNEKIRNEIDQDLIRHLQAFAFRAWRRPLATAEQEALASIYHDARSRELDPESSAREVLTRVLIAPDFLFKLESSDKPGVQPVSPFELASRLSYLIWSSMPDDALLKAAMDGKLDSKEGRAAEVKRMLRDPKAAALASEFAGQWLGFHGFSKHSAVDEKHFPEFTDALRADMDRETQAFFEHVVREDRPVREILLADYTFLNERLASHYGIPNVKGEELQKVSVSKYQRGGLLGMGSVLTKTSFPYRTSPVLRGNWLLHAILGQPTPPPPNDVPELEAVTGVKTLREKLERHREDKACASCHDKIDPLGFALEGFDAIGRMRSKDASGQPVDDLGTLKDGTKLDGMMGLRDYLGSHDGDFYNLLARKMIGYATGRSVLSTDRELIDTIRKQLQQGEGRFSEAVLSLVESRQFQFRRNEEESSEQSSP